MSEFRVEKLKHNLELTLITGEKMVGTVFLEPIARNHAGPQDPRELLNDPDPFFPFETNGALILLAKDQVKLAKYPHPKGPLPLRMTEARIILSDGQTVDGLIVIEARTEADRFLDHLNHFDGRFLPMLTGNHITQVLVNHRMIVGIKQGYETKRAGR
jgi:hypothetical protein